MVVTLTLTSAAPWACTSQAVALAVRCTAAGGGVPERGSKPQRPGPAALCGALCGAAGAPPRRCPDFPVPLLSWKSRRRCSGSCAGQEHQPSSQPSAWPTARLGTSSLPAGKAGGVGGSRCANVFGTRRPAAAAAARLELILGGHEVCRPKLVLLHAIKGRSIDTAAAKPAVPRRAGLRPAADRGRRALCTLRRRYRCACRAHWV